MIKSDEDWLGMIDAVHAAALGSGSWTEALNLLAQATGSSAAQLIGLGSENFIHFNWLTGLDPDIPQKLVAIDGGNPDVNIFLRGAIQTVDSPISSSAQFISAEDRRKDFFLNEFAFVNGVAHICQGALLRENIDMMVGMSVMRSEREGDLDDRQREIFAAIAPHFRTAVKMQIALEHQGTLLAVGAMESMSLPVLVCDQSGAVLAMTSLAEACIATSAVMALENRVLRLADAAEQRMLARALHNAIAGFPRVASTLVVRGRHNNPLILEVMPMPRREQSFGFAARALVMMRGIPASTERQRSFLQMVYGLTEAEADVALQLAAGLSPKAIAASRHVAVGTVRTQMKQVFAKTGVRRQSELAARMGGL